MIDDETADWLIEATKRGVREQFRRHPEAKTIGELMPLWEEDIRRGREVLQAMRESFAEDHAARRTMNEGEG